MAEAKESRINSIRSHQRFKCSRCSQELKSDQCYVFLDADEKLIGSDFLCRECNAEYRQRKLEFAIDFLNEGKRGFK